MTETWSSRLQFALHRLAARLSYGFTNYRHPLRRNAWAAASEMPRRIPTGTTPLECAELFNAVAACEKVNGDMAEAGVYRGGTAGVMLSASKKRLHLFDTFEGLPHGEGQFEKGEWLGSRTDVERNLGEWFQRVEFHPGLFPASAANLGDFRFSFVHLDLDLNDSTLAALEFSGHDWSQAESYSPTIIR